MWGQNAKMRVLLLTRSHHVLQHPLLSIYCSTPRSACPPHRAEVAIGMA